MNGNRTVVVGWLGRSAGVLGLVGLAALACSSSKPGKQVGAGGTGGGGGVAGVPGMGGDDGSGGMSGVGGTSTGSGGTGDPVAGTPWPALPGTAVSVQGGAATSAGGLGQPGGQVRLLAQGAVTIDGALPALPAPDVPPAGGGVTTLMPGAVTADVTTPGSILIEGGTLGGTDAVRSITAGGGNIYVMGTVRSADLGGARQAIKLNAPGGGIFIVGNLDTGGDGDAGVSGGAVEITAVAVAVTGKLTSAGGGGGVMGGAAGAITFRVNNTVTITGTVDASGGDATSADATSGGAGADVKITAGGDISLGGSLRVRGGAATGKGADAHGGAAAKLRIDCDGVVRILGSVDARGGIATAMMAGGAVGGGAAGAVLVGETAPPKELAVRGPLLLLGGPGHASGGKGGTATLTPVDGTLTIAGPRAIDASGGDSRAAPGAGGSIEGGPQRDPGTTTGVHVTGDIFANGGSIESGGSGNGAEAGTITFDMIPTLASVTIDDGAHVRVDGGASGGTGTAGGGGHMVVFTKDGDIILGGAVSARGGNAPDPGGVGGLGGQVYFFSDNNHNALMSDKGNILITSTGVVDASGGDGTVGGNARNDGNAGVVPAFPDHQEQISVFLNCDGVHGNTLNWLNNLGKVIAHGGAHDGSGGDVVYHGVSPSGNTAGGLNGNGTRNYSPPSGDINIAGDGTGRPGDYRGQ